MQPNTWQEKDCFVSLIVPKLTTALQMADKRSVEMLAFNFASRTFAYRRLAQGLSRSLSAFSSFMREYLDPVVKADQCAQYVDDIGIAANEADQLILNLRAVFECLRKAGLKLTMSKCHFGATEVDFSWTDDNSGRHSATESKSIKIFVYS